MSNHFDGTGIQLFEQSSFAESIPADHIKLFLDATSGQPAYRTPGGDNFLLGSNLVTLFEGTPTSGEFNIDLSAGEALNCIHLRGVALLKSTASATSDVPYIFFNTDYTTTNYRHSGNASLETATNTPYGGNNPRFGNTTAASSPTNEFAMFNFEIPWFRRTDFVKKFNYQCGVYYTTGASFFMTIGGVHWNSASAITSLQIRTDNHSTDTLNSACRLHLFGVKQ